MSKELIQVVTEFARLYRDPITGIAWVEDTSTGLGYSAHPNIHSTGNVRGMRLRGFWKRKDLAVPTNGFIYNISQCRVNLDNQFEVLAMRNCRCGGEHYGTGRGLTEQTAS